MKLKFVTETTDEFGVEQHAARTVGQIVDDTIRNVMSDGDDILSVTVELTVEDRVALKIKEPQAKEAKTRSPLLKPNYDPEFRRAD